MKIMLGSLIGAAVLGLVAGGCQKQTAGPDPGLVRNAIKADEKKWNDQFKSKDSEGLISHYADDAFFIAPGVKGADGMLALRKAYADATTDPAFSVSFASDKIDVAASGDMAYARGHFSEKYTDPKSSKVMTESGSYITLYKKQQDGSWKAVEDFAAADPGSTKEVPPEKPAVRARPIWPRTRTIWARSPSAAKAIWAPTASSAWSFRPAPGTRPTSRPWSR